jgi:aryl-alcohol dehydrogenase
MRVQAAVLRDTTDPFGLEDFDLAEPGPGEALVRVVGSGICRTDVHIRALPQLPMPMILGHEGAGIVEAVGPGVTRVAPGDGVVMSFDSCGWCTQCLTGSAPYCAEFIPRNVTGRRIDGSTGATDLSGEQVGSRWFGQSSFATHAIATERNIVVVDATLPLEQLGPLGCGVQTGAGAVLNVLKVQPGASIAVFGTGTVGLSAILAARMAGATEIIAVDLQATRRETALEFGATRTVDGADPELAAAIGQVDFSFDNTGVPAVVNTAIGALRPGGACALVTASVEPVIPTAALMGRSVHFVFEGGSVPQVFIPRLIKLWQQDLFPFDKMIRTYPLSKINDAECDLDSGAAIKPVLLPGTR